MWSSRRRKRVAIPSSCLASVFGQSENVIDAISTLTGVHIEIESVKKFSKERIVILKLVKS